MKQICPVRLWSLHLWRWSKPSWTQSWAICSRWLCLSRWVQTKWNLSRGPFQTQPFCGSCHLQAAWPVLPPGRPSANREGHPLMAWCVSSPLNACWVAANSRAKWSSWWQTQRPTRSCPWLFHEGLGQPCSFHLVIKAELHLPHLVTSGYQSTQICINSITAMGCSNLLKMSVAMGDQQKNFLPLIFSRPLNSFHCLFYNFAIMVNCY